MFINCPHCQALVATDPASDLPPERCPRCAARLREAVADKAASEAGDTPPAAIRKPPAEAALPGHELLDEAPDAVHEPEPEPVPAPGPEATTGPQTESEVGPEPEERETDASDRMLPAKPPQSKRGLLSAISNLLKPKPPLRETRPEGKAMVADVAPPPPAERSEALEAAPDDGEAAMQSASQAPASPASDRPDTPATGNSEANGTGDTMPVAPAPASLPETFGSLPKRNKSLTPTVDDAPPASPQAIPKTPDAAVEQDKDATATAGKDVAIAEFVSTADAGVSVPDTTPDAVDDTAPALQPAAGSDEANSPMVAEVAPDAAGTPVDAPSPVTLHAPTTPAAAVPVKPMPSFAHGRRAAHRPGSRWKTHAAIAGLAVLLGLQLLLADRAQLAADARWRPLLSSLCGALHCSLPPWREPAAFVLLARDVRPHPTLANTLHVTATFRNDARWPQPWPRLRLTLSDVDGRPVAARDFNAREYLGAAPTQNELASGQSATVAMDVREPAARSVAFDFELH